MGCSFFASDFGSLMDIHIFCQLISVKKDAMTVIKYSFLNEFDIECTCNSGAFVFIGLGSCRAVDNRRQISIDFYLGLATCYSS